MTVGSRGKPCNILHAAAKSAAAAIMVASIVATACGSPRPAAGTGAVHSKATPVTAATPTNIATPAVEVAATPTSPSCHDLLAANPAVDPTTLPRDWDIYKNSAGVSTIVPVGWTKVDDNSIVTATDPSLGRFNQLSLTVNHAQGDVPAVATVAIAEAVDLSRRRNDLVSVPESTTVTLDAGPAARLSFCQFAQAPDGTRMTLAWLQLLIPRPAGTGSYDMYILQMVAPVDRMGTYGPIFEMAAKALVLP